MPDFGFGLRDELSAQVDEMEGLLTAISNKSPNDDGSAREPLGAFLSLDGPIRKVLRKADEVLAGMDARGLAVPEMAKFGRMRDVLVKYSKCCPSNEGLGGRAPDGAFVELAKMARLAFVSSGGLICPNCDKDMNLDAEVEVDQ